MMNGMRRPEESARMTKPMKPIVLKITKEEQSYSIQKVERQVEGRVLAYWY
jgi:hypothetical protein